MFFIIYAIIGGLSIVSFIGIIIGSKLPKQVLIPLLLNIFLTTILSGTIALFTYLICSRSLLTEVRNKKD